ncbi:hypothetical protein [Owenweeksia hongkongensis]|uniref:hypothetical protein n=1 Tax=Owenweeksia hongkongensis TaxID=253245 RepID=UPI003A93393C
MRGFQHLIPSGTVSIAKVSINYWIKRVSVHNVALGTSKFIALSGKADVVNLARYWIGFRIWMLD